MGRLGNDFAVRDRPKALLVNSQFPDCPIPCLILVKTSSIEEMNRIHNAARELGDMLGIRERLPGE